MATAAATTNAGAGATQVIRTGAGSRYVIYTLLILFCLYYLLPLYVMVVNSLKPLSEIQAGGMMALPDALTFAPWASAWSSAQVGVEATGLRPYFLNSILMVVPAVAISTVLGALNGYVLTKWRFRGDTIVFGLLLFGCFIPFQMVLIPMARMLGLMGIAGTVPGLIFVHLVYGIGFSTLYFRNYYQQFPTELVRAAMIDGAGFFTIFRRIMLPSSGPIAVVCVIWQFTNIWNDFLFGASFSDFDSQPMTVALNNLVQSSTGVKEYNVHFAGAIMAALPTLLVYIVAGRFFVRGLMAGSVKG
ncbi:ABC transporter permease subunit [Stappia sp. GBMRC 2046]|uniref:ABC transporter permease subunit n=1 Tax=Stappia sediminis TaxID=2692190 RepID=A0A7X3LRW0_9HYPH|nr:carbohydrate ABC transporter permease [Stappia sediminis]MXN63968.1 ABC transporter permease subunit [Stappia sediminis]